MMVRSLVVMTACAALPGTALAVSTETWRLETAGDFRAGKLTRVVVSSEGEVSLGQKVTRAEVKDESLVWSLARDQGGALYVGAGPKGRVYRIKNPNDAAPVVEQLFETGQFVVSSLAVDAQGNVFAGTLPKGKIFKYDASAQKASELVTLESSYVWALALGDGGKLYAATGPKGTLYSIEGDKATALYASKEKHLLSLVRDAAGNLYAGSAPKGILFKVTADGKASVAHDFDGDEVRALAVHKDAVFAAVNGLKGKMPLGTLFFGAQPQQQQQGKPQQGGGQPTPGPGPGPAPGPGGGQQQGAQPRVVIAIPSVGGGAPTGDGSVYRLSGSGRVERILHMSRGYFTSLGVDDAGNAYAGSGAEARVYKISPAREVSVVLDFEEKQVLALHVQGNGAISAGTGNGAAVYAGSDKQADEGSFFSRVFDCRFPSRWGKVSWRARGKVKLQSRSGNTEQPDATWSAWAAASGESPAKVESPPARYLQLRVDFGDDKAAVLREVSAHYLQQNQRARITSLTVGDPPAGGGPSVDGGGGGGSGGGGSVISIFPMGRFGGGGGGRGGMRIGGGRGPGASGSSVQSGGPGGKAPPPKDAPSSPPQLAPAQPSKIPVHLVSRRISWKVENPDGDELVYWVYVKEQNAPSWILLTNKDPLTSTSYFWNTESFPDGHYVVKVKASDERGNPKPLSLMHERTSPPVLVDNKKPDVADLSVDDKTLEVKGVARDSFSVIRRIQYNVDGGDWQMVNPEDELFDDKEEKFRFVIDPKPASGAHSLTVRAYDSDGNVGSASIVFNVP